ncbi:YihY family inner membrane protein [Simiduia sp. 21SJ11W-1]|uniref:YihY family inner membrane protein n=1 Tax=Simiduia sp. 21SJ11W-1 TaxID=2909669 RepID=UPI0020A08C1A|nr:YihY family inner membrane protein [Simiduia sp. 21SJ11W-1]UTA46696.1 YihY family inner membrane protein [Simiduia sp. 21SJ11W-1]
MSAGALTFMTMFALVPMMTVTYSMFSLFPAFQGLDQQLNALIFSNLLPEAGSEVSEHLANFSQQARKLNLASVPLLIITAYLMLKNIEKTFNRIWGVKRGRHGLLNFLIYWAVLSLGPLLLGAGLVMSTYLLSMEFFTEGESSLGLAAWLYSYLPLLLTALAFTLLFAAVPNCRVPLRKAAIGGVVVAVLFELLKRAFGAIMGQTSIAMIYGAFAFLPLFLIWVNITWMLILSGAILVRVLSTDNRVTLSVKYPDLVAALIVLWEFRRRLVSGNSLADGDLLAAGVGSEQWQRLRDALLENQVITVTGGGDYVLCRDLSRLTLRQLADTVGVEAQMPGESDYLQQFDWFSAVAPRLLSIDQHMEQQLDVTLAEIFDTFLERPDYPDEGEGLEMLQSELSDSDTALPNFDDSARPEANP